MMKFLTVVVFVCYLAVVLAQFPPAAPPQAPPPPAPMHPMPYNIYGPVPPYASSSTTSAMGFPPNPVYPPMPIPAAMPYAPIAAGSAPGVGYPLVPAGYQPYGQPIGVAYPPPPPPPPYPTYSGSAPMPFTESFHSSGRGLCNFMSNLQEFPIVGPNTKGFFKKTKLGMLCYQ